MVEAVVEYGEGFGVEGLEGSGAGSDCVIHCSGVWSPLNA